MDSIEQLTSLFERFPGIGPRQAQRFGQFLLRSSPTLRNELIESVKKLSNTVHQCAKCFRFFSVAEEGGKEKICGICTNPKRDQGSLIVVASDADLLAFEKSGTYRGLYFVLGGTISLASEETKHLRVKELLKHINDLRGRYSDFKEIILAFPANPEGDATTVRVREALTAAPESKSIKITTLGRGLSTGSELEYADPDTIKSALESRR